MWKNAIRKLVCLSYSFRKHNRYLIYNLISSVDKFLSIFAVPQIMYTLALSSFRKMCLTLPTCSPQVQHTSNKVKNETFLAEKSICCHSGLSTEANLEKYAVLFKNVFIER